MTVLAAIQPCYLPWRGYFHIIKKCDIFVHADDLQYTKQNWRNRNRIKTPEGPQWLTVPVLHTTTKGRASISDVRIDNGQAWARHHWKTIKAFYGRAPCFKPYEAFFQDAFSRNWTALADLNIYLIENLCALLGLNRRFMRASDLGTKGRKTDYILGLCAEFNANAYLSGPAAKAYIDEEKLKKNHVCLMYQHYDYPPYPQLHGVFTDHLSIVDLLFNCGDRAGDYIWGDNSKPKTGGSYGDFHEQPNYMQRRSGVGAGG